MSTEPKAPSTIEVVPDPVVDPVVAGPTALKRARERWGLDAAPTAASQRAKDSVADQRPVEYARALLRHQPPAEWVRAVRAFSPVSEAHSFLRLVWVETPKAAWKGKGPWPKDNGRWCLYQCIPDAMLSPERRHQLTTPYWELPPTQRRGREQMVSALTFELYRTERVDARPFWVLQGNQGGTPVSYTALESRLLQVMQQPTSPPPRGALPFAPWDERARSAIAKRDALLALNGRIDALRAGASSDAQRAEAEMVEREARKATMAWWADQFEEHADFLVWYTRRTESDRTLKRLTREEARQAEQFAEQYIETGVA